MLAPWPEADPALDFPQEAAQAAGIIEAVRAVRALRAEMTGSGSAVVGLFANAQDADFAWRQCIALWPKSYLTRTTDRGVSLCP